MDATHSVTNSVTVEVIGRNGSRKGQHFNRLMGDRTRILDAQLGNAALKA
jgi:hypothetical protein